MKIFPHAVDATRMVNEGLISEGPRCRRDPTVGTLGSLARRGRCDHHLRGVIPADVEAASPAPIVGAALVDDKSRGSAPANRRSRAATQPRVQRRTRLPNFSFFRFNGSADGAALQRCQKLSAVRRSPTRAGVPTGASRILAIQHPFRVIVADGDIAKYARRAEFGVEQRVEVAGPGAHYRIETRNEACPKRRRGARAAHDLQLAARHREIAGRRIGIGGDVGDRSPSEMAGVDRRHDLAGLPGRSRRDVADAPSRAAPARAVIPYHFRDLRHALAILAHVQCSPADREYIGTGRGKIHMRPTVPHLSLRTVVSGGDARRDAKLRGGQEALVAMRDGRGGPYDPAIVERLIFVPTPAYRNYRGIVDGIVDDRAQAVDEPFFVE